jgi:hypothetical protein
MLLIWQHVGVGQAGGIKDGHVSFPITRTTGAAKRAISGDLETYPLKASQLFDVDVDHFAGLRAHVAADRLSGLDERLENPAHGAARHYQDSGHSSDSAALTAEACIELQLLWIERPPLSAPNTPSIRQCRSPA